MKWSVYLIFHSEKWGLMRTSKWVGEQLFKFKRKKNKEMCVVIWRSIGVLSSAHPLQLQAYGKQPATWIHYQIEILF